MTYQSSITFQLYRIIIIQNFSHISLENKFCLFLRKSSLLNIPCYKTKVFIKFLNKKGHQVETNSDQNCLLKCQKSMLCEWSKKLYMTRYGV